jgi:hypothetical protein
MNVALKGELHSRTRRRPPDFAPSSETSDFALSLRLQEASSDRPGGYVGQAVLDWVRWGGFDFADKSTESSLSRRDRVKVAWQFTARGRKKPNPFRRERYDWVDIPEPLNGDLPSKPSETVPYGTVLSLNPFQAVNCQATFI